MKIGNPHRRQLQLVAREAPVHARCACPESLLRRVARFSLNDP